MILALAFLLSGPPVASATTSAELSVSTSGAASEDAFLDSWREIKPISISPRPIYQPQPAFPKGVHAAGTVEIEIVVDASGSVRDAKVTFGPQPFVEPALEAVRKWRYAPVVVSGRAIAWKTHVTIHFRP